MKLIAILVNKSKPARHLYPRIRKKCRCSGWNSLLMGIEKYLLFPSIRKDTRSLRLNSCWNVARVTIHMCVSHVTAFS